MQDGGLWSPVNLKETLRKVQLRKNSSWKISTTHNFFPKAGQILKFGTEAHHGKDSTVAKFEGMHQKTQEDSTNPLGGSILADYGEGEVEGLDQNPSPAQTLTLALTLALPYPYPTQAQPQH